MDSRQDNDSLSLERTFPGQQEVQTTKGTT